ncbi:MAG: hypothetical protein RL701_1115 [Pseudomonadota bacterium]
MSFESLEMLAARSVQGDRFALDALLRAIKDDVYALSRRMLGGVHAADDATQEILLKVVTSLSQFRGDSGLRTWIWRIAARHLLRVRQSNLEKASSFAQIEQLIEEGQSESELYAGPDAMRLAEEVRMGCTQAMLHALDRDQRMAFIVGDIFELSSADAADVLEIPEPAYRKRLERSRAALKGFLQRNCGIVNPLCACRCLRQIPVAERHGLLQLKGKSRAAWPEREAAIASAHTEMRAIESMARVFDEAGAVVAPEEILTQIRTVLQSGRFKLFDA